MLPCSRRSTRFGRSCSRARPSIGSSRRLRGLCRGSSHFCSRRCSPSPADTSCRLHPCGARPHCGRTPRQRAAPVGRAARLQRCSYRCLQAEDSGWSHRSLGSRPGRTWPQPAAAMRVYAPPGLCLRAPIAGTQRPHRRRHSAPKAGRRRSVRVQVSRHSITSSSGDHVPISCKETGRVAENLVVRGVEGRVRLAERRWVEAGRALQPKFAARSLDRARSVAVLIASPLELGTGSSDCA